MGLKDKFNSKLLIILSSALVIIVISISYFTWKSAKAALNLGDNSYFDSAFNLDNSESPDNTLGLPKPKSSSGQKFNSNQNSADNTVSDPSNQTNNSLPSNDTPWGQGPSDQTSPGGGGQTDQTPWQHGPSG